MAEAYIVATARTAGGRKGGRLKGWHPVDLGGEVINALLDRSKANPELIEDVICGCVSQVGEQATMFFKDPSGNALEFKAFRDASMIFAKN